MKTRIVDRQFNNVFGLKQSNPVSNMPPGSVTDILNMYYTAKGGRRVRKAYVKAFYIGESSQVNTIHDYIKSDNTQMQIIGAGTKLFKYSSSTISTIATGFTSNAPWQMQTYLDKVFMTNGVAGDKYKKYDGTTLSNLAISPPGSAPTLSQVAGTSGFTNEVFKYYVTFYDSATGFESNPYDVQANAPSTTISAPNNKVRVTVVAKTTDDQVTSYRIYRTSNGGSALSRIATVDYTTTLAAGYYEDNGDANGTVALEYDNNVPDTGSNLIVHYKDRLYMAINDPVNGSIIIYSKSSARPFAYPTTNFKPVGANDGSNILWMAVYRDYLIIYKGNGIYYLNADPDSSGVVRSISNIGLQNTYCAVTNDDFLLGLTTLGYYSWKPTEFDITDLRKTNIGYDIKTNSADIHRSSSSVIRSIMYETDEVKHAYFPVPHETAVVANLWHVFDYKNGQWSLYELDHTTTAFGLVQYSGQLRLYFGDPNGYIWRFDEGYAEGADRPNTVLTNHATSGVSYTSTVMTDTGQSWTVNEFAGMYLYSELRDEKVLISSNTATTITHAAWTTTPSANSTYYIGRSRKYCTEFWNSKKSPEMLKRMKWLQAYFDQVGRHSVNITGYKDFSSTEMGDKEVTLSNPQALWGPTGGFLWGEHWGVQTTRPSRLRFNGKFKYANFKFWNNKAGEYFGLDGYSVTYQELYDRV